jgi:hypothetical protein
MPKDRDISLKVQNVPSNGIDNYTNVIASDGSVYSYQFSEVDDSGDTHIGGNVSFTSRGKVKININVPHDPRDPADHYQIDYVEFAGDVKQQLSWNVQRTPFKAMLDNTNDDLANVYYLVIVRDTDPDKNNCTIRCDPMINNRGPA